MTKAELIEKISKATNMQNSAVETVLVVLGEIYAAELLAGGECPCPRLGKLKTKATSARQGCNPRTGLAIAIPAGRRIVFVPRGELKQALRGR